MTAKKTTRSQTASARMEAPTRSDETPTSSGATTAAMVKKKKTTSAQRVREINELEGKLSAIVSTLIDAAAKTTALADRIAASPFEPDAIAISDDLEHSLWLALDARWDLGRLRALAHDATTNTEVKS